MIAVPFFGHGDIGESGSSFKDISDGFLSSTDSLFSARERYLSKSLCGSQVVPLFIMRRVWPFLNIFECDLRLAVISKTDVGTL
jgi:hypothetical protein